MAAAGGGEAKAIRAAPEAATRAVRLEHALSPDESVRVPPEAKPQSF